MTRTLRQRTRPLRHGLARGALGLLFASLRLLPLPLARRIGAGLGRVIGLCARSETRRMQRRLDEADLPTQPTTGACWADLGRRAVELALWRKVLPEVVFTEEARACFDEALAQDQGLIVATAHYGHWELMAAAIAAAGYTAHTVVARPKVSPLHRWLSATRAAMGVIEHPPGGGARQVLRLLADNHAVGMLVDQDTGERSVTLPFLGRPAPTSLTAARVKTLSRSRLCFTWCTFEGSIYRVRAVPIPDQPTPHALMHVLNEHIADLVKADPTQWVWLHDRWGDQRS